MKAFTSPIQALLLITAVTVSTPAIAQKAEPAVQPEDPAAEQLPLERAVERTRPPALIIELPPLEPTPEDDEEPHAITPHPARIGVHRLLPEPWQGDLAAHLDSGSIEITSTGAQSVRVALSAVLPDGGQIIFSGPEDDPLYILEANEIPVGDEPVWSPVIDDETIRIDLSDAGPNANIIVRKVAHISYSTSESDPQQPHLSCSNHLDVQCRAGRFPDNQDDSIAQLIFEKSDGTYACSGVLMSDTGGTFEPYVLTARHCIPTHTVAASVFVRWFYQTQSCNSARIDSRWTTTPGGADLLETSVSDDMALLRLRRDPPAAVTFSGWDATPVDFELSGTRNVHVLSHPGGGAMKYTSAQAGETLSADVPGRSEALDAIKASVMDGAIEVGSSGAGLFDDQYLIGTLSAGQASRPGGACHSTLYSGTLHGFYPQVERYLDPEPVYERSLVYFLPVGTDRESYARIASDSDTDGIVTIKAWDDRGASYGPVELQLGPRAAVHLNSSDLEQGNPDKGLDTGIGDGEGNWRLEFSSESPLKVSGYLRTSDRFLTSMHDVVPETDELVYEVPFFAPHGTWNQRLRSWLRLVNPNQEDIDLTISGFDDSGRASRGKVNLTLPAEGSRMLSEQQLEQGDEDLDGSLGNGRANWRLVVSATRPVWVMNILQSPTGHISNLSTEASLPVPEIPAQKRPEPEPEPEEPEPTEPPEEPEPSTPPMPSSIGVSVSSVTTTSGTQTTMRISWSYPSNYSAHHRLTRIYRNNSDDFHGAIEIGTTSDSFYAQTYRGGPYWFWIRWESSAGVLGPPSRAIKIGR